MKVMYKTNPNYSAQNVSGLTVIIPISEECPKFNGMLKLVGTGPFLWKVFSKGATVESACEEVLKKYDVTFDQALKDIKEFVSSLSELNLLVKVSK